MYGDLSENLLKDFEAERVKGEILIAHNPSPREFFSSTHGLLGLLQVAVTRDTKYSSEFASQIPGRVHFSVWYGGTVYVHVKSTCQWITFKEIGHCDLIDANQLFPLLIIISRPFNRPQGTRERLGLVVIFDFYLL